MNDDRLVAALIFGTAWALLAFAAPFVCVGLSDNQKKRGIQMSHNQKRLRIGMLAAAVASTAVFAVTMLWKAYLPLGEALFLSYVLTVLAESIICGGVLATEQDRSQRLLTHAVRRKHEEVARKGFSKAASDLRKGENG